MLKIVLVEPFSSNKFENKVSLPRDSNPGFLREKLLPYHLSHDGVVNKVKLIHGATHISFAKFLVAPNSVWKPLSISQCVCVCTSLCAKIWKNSRGIELQMSACEANTLPNEPFRTFNLSDYFTK